MAANSEKIRLTVWLPRKLYYSMNDKTEPRGESHADFVRRAIQTQVRQEDRPVPPASTRSGRPRVNGP